MEKKVFRARINVLLIVFIGGIHAGMCYWMSTLSGSFFNPGTYILIVSFVGVVFSFRSYCYVLTENEIQVRYFWGLPRKPYCTIFISTITSVERSYNPIGWASRKNLRFCFKKNQKGYHISLTDIFPVVSPVREKEFLETLKSINPNIQINVTDKKGWWRFWDWDI